VRLGRRPARGGILKSSDTLQITTPSDVEVRLTRLFDDGMAAGYDRLDGLFAELA